ncbi:hypothetical protein ACJQWY_02040 [Weissella kandleri]|uniref:hypothetical protein n=1 Tax=Weissella kandleri TaxID=1616 RepID=UPI00387EC4B4
MKIWLKRILIFLLILCLSGSLYLNFKLKSYYDIANHIQQTKIKPGQYYKNNDKSKKVIVHDNLVNINGQDFYMIQSVDQGNTMLTIQNLHTNSSFIYKIDYGNNKYILRLVKNGRVGKIAFTWNQ